MAKSWDQVVSEGGPAYPTSPPSIDGNREWQYGTIGMTLREHAAIVIFAGLMASEGDDPSRKPNHKYLSRRAVQAADALLAALARPAEPEERAEPISAEA